MKVIDLIIKSFNNELQDKTIFKVLNQQGHDKYIYNIEEKKFRRYEDESCSLVVNSETSLWEIEIIEENKDIEKLWMIPPNAHEANRYFVLIQDKINELVDKVNELESKERGKK